LLGARPFLKSAGHSRTVSKEAAQIRLRAKRKARDVEAKGDREERARQSRPEKGNSALRFLSDLEISKIQSSRWQQIANVPE